MIYDDGVSLTVEDDDDIIEAIISGENTPGQMTRTH